ncbi:ABC transporter permease [Gloeocapsopsis dulcis]|uniref:ABC transporter permease n=1 Tax=Gloeocapsopsis dulcis AAB1 = 1H9 TaxID=1433147 RepID=A0A6N8FXB5_9CHRO|nr:ABC transporter permease [Gloeocapsopsis dulcis]MUL37404.1 ABC transporter permease [Gloeocapsopsis dulcis AAB1 = 1H9]WNN87380.1 ABC transporter permease [Gloeocapsopsis dulcis]
MDILESVKMASKTLLANKLRSTLTMLGIIIGNASVIAMVGIGEGAQRFVSGQFESLGTNVLFIVPGNRDAQRTTVDLPKTLVLEDAEAIATQVPTVAAVAPQLHSRELVTYRNRNTYSLIVGTNPDFSIVRSFDAQRGRFITDLDVTRNNQVATLGVDLAERLFGNQDPVGQQVRIRNISFLVIGVMEAKGSVLGTNYDDSAYIPVSTMASRIIGENSPYGVNLTFISVSAQSEASVDAAQFQITNLLRLRHKITREDDFSVQSQKDVLEIAGTVTGALTIMLAAIAGISLLVGGIGVMNIMLVSVTERTQEIGLRKAIGATQDDVLIQFLIEAVILSAAGGLLGTALGVGGVLLIGAFTPFQAGVSPIAIALAVGVSGGIGIIFGVVPARRAAQLDPIVALRSA